jgi:hypothetical protein
MKKPYIKHEEQVMRYLVMAWKTFLKLDATYPDHAEEFAKGIHSCQDVIIHRIVQRTFPKEFPTYKDKNARRY